MHKISGPEAKKYCRSVDIMADAAYGILIKSPQSFTGNLVYDEDFLMNEGITDLDQYRAEPGRKNLFTCHTNGFRFYRSHFEVSNINNFFAGSSDKLFPDLFTDEVPDFSILGEIRKN